MKGNTIPVAIVVGVVAIILLFVRPWSGTRVPDARPERVEAPRTSPGSRSGQGPALAQVVYLFDVSRSVHTGAAGSAYQRSIGSLRRAVTALSGDQGLPSPQEHTVGVIGSYGMTQHPICTMTVSAPTVFVRSGTTVEDSISACEERLRRLPPEPSTDISGSVKFASLMVQGTRPAARAIILITDLDEDLPQGSTPGHADLAGVCVFVLYEATGAVASNPSLLDSRVRNWRATFTGWGAGGAEFRLRESSWSDELAAVLRDCAAGRAR